MNSLSVGKIYEKWRGMSSGREDQDSDVDEG
jgi:hypothetical protein